MIAYITIEFDCYYIEMAYFGDKSVNALRNIERWVGLLLKGWFDYRNDLLVILFGGKFITNIIFENKILLPNWR
jgi:hypothetical protein